MAVALVAALVPHILVQYVANLGGSVDAKVSSSPGPCPIDTVSTKSGFQLENLHGVSCSSIWAVPRYPRHILLYEVEDIATPLIHCWHIGPRLSHAPKAYHKLHTYLNSNRFVLWIMFTFHGDARACRLSHRLDWRQFFSATSSHGCLLRVSLTNRTFRNYP